MGGVAFQQFFILVFVFFAIKFHQTILQRGRQGVEGGSHALQLLYAVYAVLTLISVHFSVLLQSQSLTFYEDEDWLSARRIRPWVPESHTYPRGLSILPRLCPNVMCPCHTQCPPSRSHHAWQRK